MRRMSAAAFPTCHLAHVAGPDRRGGATAMWICEYPYRTMRAEGPSAECADCPVWQAMERAKGHATETTAETQNPEFVPLQIH